MVIYTTMRNNFLYYAYLYEEGVKMPILNKLVKTTIIRNGKKVDVKCRAVQVDTVNRVALFKWERRKSSRTWRKMLELETK